MPDTLTVLSLGAGVQSTTLALGDRHNLWGLKIDAAVFADTGDEPQEVYDHLERLKGMVDFPIHIVRQGPSLGQEFLDHLNGLRPSAAQPPFYVRQADLSQDEIMAILAEPEPRREDFRLPAQADDSDIMEGLRSDEDEMFNVAWANWNSRRKQALRQDAGGMLWRGCTRDWKIVPIRRAVRKLMAETGATHVRQMIGISTDERQRERASGVKYILNLHPLLDYGWSRQTCEAWLQKHFGMKIPKSACVYCPYRSNAGWARFKREMPEEFERACKYDEAMRDTQKNPLLNGASVRGQLFVWRGFKPLREANFETGQSQMDFGFEQECDGMCGM